MNKNTYLFLAIFLIVVLIFLHSSTRNKNVKEHLTQESLKNYISTETSKRIIKLKWINPDNGSIFYLGAIPKNKIDPDCTSFDYYNKNHYSNPNVQLGTLIRPNYLLLLVNEKYIQNTNCSPNCIGSKFDESYFNFTLTELYREGKQVYKLSFIPKNASNEIHSVAYVKHVDETNNIGEIQSYGSHMNYLSIVRESQDTTPSTQPGPKSQFVFNIESSSANGFKIFYDNVPVYNSNRTSIVGTTRKYVGAAAINACNNYKCSIDTCRQGDKRCINCCSMDHKNLFLYDQSRNNSSPTSIGVTTFIPEDATLFSTRQVNCTSDCAVDCTFSPTVPSSIPPILPSNTSPNVLSENFPPNISSNVQLNVLSENFPSNVPLNVPSNVLSENFPPNVSLNVPSNVLSENFPPNINQEYSSIPQEDPFISNIINNDPRIYFNDNGRPKSFDYHFDRDINLLRNHDVNSRRDHHVDHNITHHVRHNIRDHINNNVRNDINHHIRHYVNHDVNRVVTQSVNNTVQHNILPSQSFTNF
jgi:hypothetical protein